MSTVQELPDQEEERTARVAAQNKLAMRSPLLMAEKFSRGEWKRARHLSVIDWEFRNLLASDAVDLLIVKCPVRHGKSQYLARWAPAWYLLNNPHSRVMICTNTATLASAHSRWVRDKVHELAPVVGIKGIDPTHASVRDWALDLQGGGGCLAAGVGTSIVGFGANLLIIDDYLKDAKSAYSEKTREDQWQWFLSTSSTRLEPGGKICLLCTQWHADDLIGRIMKNRSDLEFRVRCVTLQALREENGTKDPLKRSEGEALWPERWSAEVMERRKRQAGIWWHALYQGSPKGSGLSEWPDSYFANIWVDECDWPDKFTLSASFLDPSKGKHARVGDYSAIVTVGWHNGALLVESSIDRRNVQKMIADYVAWNRERRVAFVGLEANAWQDLLAEDYWQAADSMGYNADHPILVTQTTNKNLRIERLGKWLHDRRLRFRRTASNELLVAQLQEFPFGRYDDGPDGLEGAVNLLCKCVDELQGLHEVTESPAL